MPRTVLASTALVLLPLGSADAGAQSGGRATALVVERATSKASVMQRPATVTIRMALDFASEHGSGTIDMSDIFEAEGAAPSAAALFKGPYVQLSGLRAYVKLAGFQLFRTAKPWLYLDATHGGGGTDLAVDYFHPRTPVGAIAAYRRAGAKITPQGRQVLRGVATTKYRVVTDEVRAVSAFAPPGLRTRAVAAAQKLVGLTHSRTVACDVWADTSGTAWRQRCSSVYSVNEKPLEFGRVVDVIDVLRFGTPVHAQAPPAAQVMSESEWQRAASGGGGHP